MKKNYRFSTKLLISLVVIIFTASISWSQNFSSLANGVNGRVRTAVRYNGSLVIGGDFTSASGLSAHRIARWNGSYWTALGSGMNDDVNALIVYNGDLYAAGNFTSAGGVSAHRIAKWNGSNWSPLGLGVNDEVEALEVYNGDLYVAGHFSSASGVSAHRIAKWNGSLWSAVGLGTNNTIYALAVFNNELYAGGRFSSVGGTSVGRIARWNGSNWNSVGSGVTDGNSVYTLKTISSNLYVGGNFDKIGGISSENIGKWNGSSWSGLGNGVNGNGVLAIEIYSGQIYIGGSFTSIIGGTSANRIARWTGSGFAQVSSGTNNTVRSLLNYYGTMVAVGDFTAAGGISVNRVTMYGSIPAATTLISPPDGAQNVPLTPQLVWTLVPNASNYTVQISTSANFNTLVLNTTLGGLFYNVPSGLLSANVTYFWRVRTLNALGTGTFSSIFFFNSVLTGMGDPNEVLTKWNLYRNYPNPFNPSTKIKFDVPANRSSSKVQLVVFNSAGEQVQTLLNSEFAPGRYEVEFNAKNLSSGVYFYRLIADDFVDTKKMILVK